MANCLCRNFTFTDVLWPDLMNKTLKVRCMPLPIESVVSAALSPVATKSPMGVAFAEVSPDFRFCINTHCHCGAVFTAPGGFAIVTLVVCMLAAWGMGTV